MVKQTENTYIQTISPLLSPDAIKQQVPVTEKAMQLVTGTSGYSEYFIR